MDSRFGSMESDVDIVALARDGVGTAQQRLISIRKMTTYKIQRFTFYPHLPQKAIGDFSQ